MNGVLRCAGPALRLVADKSAHHRCWVPRRVRALVVWAATRGGRLTVRRENDTSSPEELLEDQLVPALPSCRPSMIFIQVQAVLGLHDGDALPPARPSAFTWRVKSAAGDDRLRFSMLATTKRAVGILCHSGSPSEALLPSSSGGAVRSRPRGRSAGTRRPGPG
jgi:hypothetical protein